MGTAGQMLQGTSIVLVFVISNFGGSHCKFLLLDTRIGDGVSGKGEGDQEPNVETVENGGLRKSGEDLSAVRANMDYSDDEYGIDYFDYRHDERKKLKCKCSKNYDPVCGNNGKTYANDCIMKCDNAARKHDGRCEKVQTCVCPKERLNQQRAIYQEWKPVCGKDGLTYANNCDLLCNGKKKKYEGECKKKKRNKKRHRI